MTRDRRTPVSAFSKFVSVLTDLWIRLLIQIRTHQRHLMLLKIRRKQLNWKKWEMMLSRKRNMKLRRTFILKRFNWTQTPDHCGQIVRHVETRWKNMTMLWSTVYLLFQLTQKILRRVFKLYFERYYISQIYQQKSCCMSLKTRSRQ